MTVETSSSSSSSSSSIKINLNLIIDSSAFVHKNAQIKVVPKLITPKDDKNNTITNKNENNTNSIITPNVQLTISHGNVFHPQSKMTIYIPIHKNQQQGQNQSSSSSNQEYKLKIGEFNLFEEESECYLEVREDHSHGGRTNEDDKDDGENNTSLSMTLMGSYNQFAPRCKVYTHIIGNGNIFHPFCDLYFIHNDIHNQSDASSSTRDEMMMIGNGNIFNSFVSMKHIRNNNRMVRVVAGHENEDSKEDNNNNDMMSNSYQNQVFFIVSPPSSVMVSASASASASSSESESDISKVMQRTNENGVRKNMNDVTLLLSATKNIFIKNKKEMMR